MKLAPTTQFVSVELTYRDGSVSEIKSLRTANRSNNQTLRLIEPRSMRGFMPALIGALWRMRAGHQVESPAA